MSSNNQDFDTQDSREYEFESCSLRGKNQNQTNSQQQRQVKRVHPLPSKLKEKQAYNGPQEAIQFILLSLDRINCIYVTSHVCLICSQSSVITETPWLHKKSVQMSHNSYFTKFFQTNNSTFVLQLNPLFLITTDYSLSFNSLLSN